MTERYFIDNENISLIDSSNLNKETVGEKAYGLLTMPALWTPTFFVISKNLYKSYVECKNTEQRETFLNTFMSRIMTCVEKLGLKNDCLIIRSSSIKEGLQERGRFESIKCCKNDFKEKLTVLIHNISQNCLVPNNEMPFVVQKYIDGTVTGHLSNEYRFSKEVRDWKYQTECNGDVSELKSLSIRNWRERANIGEITQRPLLESSLKNALKLLAAYYTEKKQRCHIEFVYESGQLYAVQADEDTEEDEGVNPTLSDIKMSTEDIHCDFDVLRPVNLDDVQKYQKIRNVSIYHSVGLTTVPLYILDNIDVIKDLSNEKMTEGLKNDLERLLNKSIVIRSDILSDDIKERQMLKRSNELKNLIEVQNWLFEHSKKILDENGVFILHNFIPALAAAFAYAKPRNRKVEIQSLWGLPEGLYYNAHDTIIVDTKVIEISKLDPEIIYDEDIIKKPQYKSVCILPESTGEWRVKKIARSHNWKCSIEDNVSIKQIAIESRKIADAENKNLSIMWFVGIDEQYYKTKNIPWYHEQCTVHSYTNDSYKRKYFSNEEVVIKNESDIDALNDNPIVKCIRIQPDNDDALRDRNFIKKVGTAAKKQNLMILLEGAVLAHSFYQLINTGANVIVAHNFKEYSEELEFNKLVRDKIPESILAGGEQVQCGQADDNLYLYLLLNKLLEEAYEAYDANESDLIYELADIYEVCESILMYNWDKIWFIPREVIPNGYNNAKPNKIFLFKHYLNNKEYRYYYDGDYVFCIALSRKKQFYELELKVHHKKANTNAKEFTESNERTEISNLVDMASELLGCSNIFQIKRIVNNIKRTITESIFPSFDISISDFESVKRKKKDKNGGFEKKLVLLKTKFSGDDTSTQDIKQYKILHTLVQKGDRTIELLKNNASSDVLLLRKKISVEQKNFIEEFDSDKINDFFGVDIKLLFFFKHTSKTITFGITKENKKIDKQLRFSL